MRKIEISPAFPAFLCIFYYFDPAQSFFPFLAAAAIHELGHLLALYCMGEKLRRLHLGFCGAVMETGPMSCGRELIAAAAGPAVNLLFFRLLLRKSPMFALLHLGLACYNLLPLYPLDGGRILRNLLYILLPADRVEIAERIFSVSVLVGLITGAFYLCCVRHMGLWPVLLCGAVLLRTGQTSRSGRRSLRREAEGFGKKYVQKFCGKS